MQRPHFRGPPPGQGYGPPPPPPPGQVLEPGYHPQHPGGGNTHDYHEQQYHPSQQQQPHYDFGSGQRPSNGYGGRPPGAGPPGQFYGPGRPPGGGANLQPSPSIRGGGGFMMGRGSQGPGPGPGRPMMMGPPYCGRPPPHGFRPGHGPPPPPLHTGMMNNGAGPGHGTPTDAMPAASMSTPTQNGLASPSPRPPRRVLTLQVLDTMRQQAKTSGDPAAQFDYAKALIEAAVTFGNDDTDLKRQKKNKEALFLEGLKIIKRLATTGMGRSPAYPEAQFFLATCHGNGSLGLQVDHDKAFQLYVQAAKQNHPAAIYRAGVCYELGAGTKRDYSRAMQYFRKAASMGDPTGMFKLGMVLLKGMMGQQANSREAITWLKRAAAVADEEHPHALHELGLCFENSGGAIPGIIPDETYARELFTQAAGFGYAPSQFKLGHCYEYGALTCPVDPRRSIAWYTRAVEQNDAESELGLSGWYLTGAEGVLKQSDTEAYLWAKKAADKGLARAEYALGYYTEVGIGVKQDLEEARRWYLRAAAQGNNRAKKRLTDMKKMGGPIRRVRHDRQAHAAGRGPDDDNCKVM
ncbi:hypothetical protein EDD11_003366 [Mortierella claussenii]|nr:hypothetical protein EDD11_003366 [Mortierella claussenii]